MDHAVLKQQIMQIRSGMLQDGTAIGMGLATAVDRLHSSKVKSKVIILLTDGVNNTGLVDPLTALEIAKAYKIKVYTVGVGTIGKAPFPTPMPDGSIQMQMTDVQIDEPLMKKIASETGGRYFRATDNTSLQNIYHEIDKLERTKVEITSYKRFAEHFFPLAMIALACLLLLGTGDMISVYVRHLLVQFETPDEIRGRVSAVNAVFIGASNELGEFESGVTAGWLGLTRAVVFGGVATLAVTAIWAWRFPILSRMDRFPHHKE